MKTAEYKNRHGPDGRSIGRKRERVDQRRISTVWGSLFCRIPGSGYSPSFLPGDGKSFRADTTKAKIRGGQGMTPLKLIVILAVPCPVLSRQLVFRLFLSAVGWQRRQFTDLVRRASSRAANGLKSGQVQSVRQEPRITRPTTSKDLFFAQHFVGAAASVALQIQRDMRVADFF